MALYSRSPYMRRGNRVADPDSVHVEPHEGRLRGGQARDGTRARHAHVAGDAHVAERVPATHTLHLNGSQISPKYNAQLPYRLNSIIRILYYISIYCKYCNIVLLNNTKVLQIYYEYFA